MTDQAEPKIRYAGFNMRMLASLIDTVLSMVALGPLFLVLDKVFGFTHPRSGMGVDPRTMSPEEMQQVMDNFYQAIPSLILQSVVLMAVIVIFWMCKGATPGKMLLRMKIVDVKTGAVPGKVQSVVRYLGYFLSVLPLGFGFVWIFYDKRHQGFHDKLAGTVVVMI